MHFCITMSLPGQLNEVNFLEHVQVHVTADYTQRGLLSVQLTTPAGTKVRFISSFELLGKNFSKVYF